mgnify:CR=1 FL=1
MEIFQALMASRFKFGESLRRAGGGVSWGVLVLGVCIKLDRFSTFSTRVAHIFSRSISKTGSMFLIY